METKNDYFKNRELRLLQDKININKRLLECYYLRLFLIDTNKAIKNEYDKNEDVIKTIITHSKIDVLKQKIQNLEDEFLSMYNQ